METTTKSMKPMILVLIFCPYHIDNGIKTKSKNAENHVEKKKFFFSTSYVLYETFGQ